MMQSSDSIMMSQNDLTFHSSLRYDNILGTIVFRIQQSITLVRIWLASLTLVKYYPFEHVIYFRVSYTPINGNLKGVNFN